LKEGSVDQPLPAVDISHGHFTQNLEPAPALVSGSSTGRLLSKGCTVPNVEMDSVGAMDRQRLVGTLGVVIAVSVAVILGAHPFGDTELYDDGSKFVDHVGWFWVVIHVVGAVLFLGIPTVMSTWADTLQAPVAQVFGRMAASISTGAVALAVLHFVGTDTTSFITFKDTVASGQEGAASGADVLVGIHAATLMALVITLFVAMPLAAALATAFDGDRGWRFWLPMAIAGLSVAAASVTLRERQWTTLSEMGLLRPAITLFVIWLGLIGYRLRRQATETQMDPASTAIG
jgi:hypothetical protein